MAPGDGTGPRVPTGFDLAGLGHNLREARIAAGMTIPDLAALAQISEAHLRYLEAGKRLGALTTWWSLAEALSVRVGDLVDASQAGRPQTQAGRWVAEGSPPGPHPTRITVAWHPDKTREK